jgi:hypothetical protein
MKTRDASVSHALIRQLPEPARALRIARLLIPLCILGGLLAEPFLHWLVPILSALPLRLPSFLL